MAHASIFKYLIHQVFLPDVIMTQSTATTQAKISIATGPAGRAMAETMTQEIVEQLQAHLNLERQSSAA